MQWGITLLIGPLVYWVYRSLVSVVASQFDLLTRAFYPILINYGPAALFLASMFLLHRKLFFPDIKFVGRFNRKQVLAGVIGISLVYLAAYGAAWFLGQPREPSMVSLYQFRTGPQIAVLSGRCSCYHPSSKSWRSVTFSCRRCRSDPVTRSRSLPC